LVYVPDYRQEVNKLTKMTELLLKDRKLRALFSGMIGTGVAFVALIIAAGVLYF
jgi:hypothetical protein